MVRKGLTKQLKRAKVYLLPMRRYKMLNCNKKNTPKLEDSKHKDGKRVFISGAVRDIATGKGRYDLIYTEGLSSGIHSAEMLIHPESKVKIGRSLGERYNMVMFLMQGYVDSADGRGDRESIAGDIIGAVFLAITGAQSPEQIYDPIKLTKLMRGLAKRYEEGGIHYGDNNWKLGLPDEACMDSGLRHLTSYMAGDKDEEHDIASIWNFMALYFNAKETRRARELEEQEAKETEENKVDVISPDECTMPYPETEVGNNYEYSSPPTEYIDSPVEKKKSKVRQNR